MNNINYDIILNAIKFYQQKQFIYTDVEWVCSNEIARMTMHPLANPFYLAKKTLVGSAEQSFLDMIRYQNLQPNRYVAASPCFRNEKEDDLHAKYFFKVELIDFKNVHLDSMFEIIEIAKEFFSQYLKVETIQTEENAYDIVDSLNKIELGSYGLRGAEGINWIYATGVAEPRLSKVINLQSLQ